MLAALIRIGFFTNNEAQRKALTKHDPYLLYKEGLDDALTGPEFARAQFHINQRRSLHHRDMRAGRNLRRPYALSCFSLHV